MTTAAVTTLTNTMIYLSGRLPEVMEKTSSNQPIWEGGIKRILMKPTSALLIL